MRKYFSYFQQLIIAFIVAEIVYEFVKVIEFENKTQIIILFMLTYFIIYIVFMNIYKNINHLILKSLHDIENILEIDDHKTIVKHKSYRAEKRQLYTLLQDLIQLITQAHDHIEDLEKLTDAKSKTLQTVTNVSHQYLEHDHLSDYYHLILSSAIQVIDTATKGSILVRDNQSGRYKYQTSVGYDFEILKKVDFSLDQTFIQNYETETATIVSNIQNYANGKLSDEQYQLLEAAGGFAISDVISAPIIIDGEIHAILNIDSTIPNAFDNIDLQLIQFFTAQISLALKNKLQIDETVKMSRFDQLTNVYNRNFFENYILKRYDNLNAYDSCAIVLCDLDNLKIINDTYGHTAGDEMLKTFAQIVSAEIRATDFVARVGGDEFIILLNNLSAAQADFKMNMIYELCLTTQISYNGNRLPVRFSYGIATSPEDSMVYPILQKIADQRMYEFKSLHKVMLR